MLKFPQFQRHDISPELEFAFQGYPVCKSELATNTEDGITLIQGDISHHSPVIRLSFRIQLSRAIGNSP